MQCSNGIYYTKIYNYADYIKAKEIYSGLLEMEQQDFENNFLLILAGENYDTTNLYISNISTDEQKMYIDLKRKNSLLQKYKKV